MRTMAVTLAVTLTFSPLGLLPVAADPAGESSPLFLPELIQQLRQNNPDLLAARKRLEAAQAKIPMAKG